MGWALQTISAPLCSSDLNHALMPHAQHFQRFESLPCHGRLLPAGMIAHKWCSTDMGNAGMGCGMGCARGAPELL